uniref:DUF4350 domain-containing protein n=1 Tax=Nocardioides sp. TaxID=35761 RepID=UPI002B27BA86
IAVVVLTQGPVERSADLDPDNPGPDGAQAVARVLADEGVNIELARSADDLDAATVGSDTLVVVTSSDQLGTSTTDRLLARVAGDGAVVADGADGADGAALVVIDPTTVLLAELGVTGDRVALDDSSSVSGDCADPSYDGLTLSVDAAAALPLPGCFDDVLVSEASIGGSGLTLLGAGELLSNDQVLRGDNAAIALRLLGGRERLVWYVASTADQVADDGVSISSLLPRWLYPSLGLLLAGAVLLVLWRARRLGPLATEPLPVVVKAIETTRSRGRLYLKSGDRAHAANALRSATRQRLTEHLRLGTDAEPPAVLSGVARHLGRPESDLAPLIGASAPVPGSDRDLIVLANDLAALEEEVRRA